MIQNLVDDIHSAISSQIPINPFEIAEAEGIEIAEISNSTNFHGRIEYLRGLRKFVIYCPENTTGFPNSIIRFSVSHELGHYYIKEHRLELIKGKSHNSRPCFLHSDPQEKEADEFAGRLLIPDSIILPAIKEKGYLTLKQIKSLADQCKTSITATAIRYVKIAQQPSAVLTSENGFKKIYWPSPETDSLGFGGVGKGYIPPNSITARVAKTGCDEDGGSDTAMWFSQRRAFADLWEEACLLGNTGTILTLFTFTFKNQNDEEWNN